LIAVIIDAEETKIGGFLSDPKLKITKTNDLINGLV